MRSGTAACADLSLQARFVFFLMLFREGHNVKLANGGQLKPSAGCQNGKRAAIVAFHGGRCPSGKPRSHECELS